MNKERRRSENTALRDLVDTLTNVINARDALWSLSFIDRLFRFKKYRMVISNYDNAMQDLRNAIRAVTSASVSSDKTGLPLPNKTRNEDERLSISMEEFEMLLGKPELQKKLPKRKSPETQ